MSVNDGGPAFPVECYFNEHGPSSGIQTGNTTGFAMGISVHDYFAAKAMQGLLSGRVYNPGQSEQIAKDAKNIADAMLAARGTK